MKYDLIYTSYSPNSREIDLRLNQDLLLDRDKWFDGPYPDYIESYFEQIYSGSKAYTYNYARSALFHLLQHFPHQDGDEIIFQGFTCIAASLPAIWSGFKPVYVDIDKEILSMNVDQFKNAITDRTKVVVIQLTMGYSPDVKKIIEIASENELLIVEDCTHYIPFTPNPPYGGLGDISIFSFGRDKVVSGVDGGVLLINDPEYFDIIDENYEKLEFPSNSWLLKRLLFAPTWHYVKKYYKSGFGKLIHLIASKTGVLTRATSPAEKKGNQPEFIPAKLPSSLAQLAHLQIEELQTIQKHRDDISLIYLNGLKEIDGLVLYKDWSFPPLRYPLLHKKRDLIIRRLQEELIFLGDWYSKPVAPAEISTDISCYLGGSCRNSEDIAQRIFNLPTHINITKEDALRIIEAIKIVLSEND